jgi:hypothetical protein
MAHQVICYLAESDGLGDVEAVFSDWISSYDTLRTNYRNVPQREDGTLQAYHEFTAEILYTEDTTQPLASVKDLRFPGADWFVVHHRHSGSESSEYVDDESYYSPLMDTGLRSSPSFGIQSPQARTYESIHYRIDGESFTVPSGSIDFSGVGISDGATLFATHNEELAIDGDGVPVADVTDNAVIDGTRSPHVEPMSFSLPTTDDSLYFARGEPPSYFKDPAEPFPARVEPDAFTRNYVSDDSISKLESKLEGISADNDDVRDVLRAVLYILTGDNRFQS